MYRKSRAGALLIKSIMLGGCWPCSPRTGCLVEQPPTHLQQEVNEMAKDVRHFALIPETTLLSSKFKQLRQSSKLLYFYMANRRAGYDKEFTYSYTDMREDTGMKEETITKCIRQLAQVEFLEYTHGGLEQSGNVYYLYPKWLEL